MWAMPTSRTSWNSRWDDNVRRDLESARRGHRARVRLIQELEQHAVTAGNVELAGKWHTRGADYREQVMLIDDLLRRLDRRETHKERSRS